MRFVYFLLAASFGNACVPNDAPTKKEKESALKAAPPKAAVPAAGGRPGVEPAARERLARALSSATVPTPSAPDPLLETVFYDNFDRTELGPDWAKTSGRWKLVGGQLCVQGARNHPVWLKRRLPVNARIEFEAVSKSGSGDIKAEFWGDGRSAAKGVSYDHATSYLAIFGGWKNQFHVLARIDEHAPNRPEIRVDRDSDDLRARPVVENQLYQFKVERNDGKTVHWHVDDIELLTYPDPEPLKGPGHEHFGFNNWEVPLCFDNLRITPLP